MSQFDAASMPVTPEPGAPTGFDGVTVALHRVAACVETAGPRQAEAARLIRLGRLDEAFPVMTECMTLWQEVQVSLGVAAAAISRPVEQLASLVLTNAGETDRAPLAELTAILTALKQSVQHRDWIGLADTLEYDLGDLAHRWRVALLQPDENEAPAAAGNPGMARSAPAA